MLKDRIEAGRKLADKLAAYKNASDTVVLALPRGGVVVGFEIARALGLPLDIVVSRKIGSPDNPEYAIGAITEAGDLITDPEVARHLDKIWLQHALEFEKREAARRKALYRTGPAIELIDKIVLLVDDGIATGYTLTAAIKSARASGVKKIIIAIPHGPPDIIKELHAMADEVVVLETPAAYFAVAAHYAEFPEVSDAEVIKLMQMARRK